MSRSLPYQPIGQRVCTTTHAQMDEKLQRRLQEIASKAVLKSGESVDPETGEIHVEQPEPQLRPVAEQPAVQPGVVGPDQAPRLLSWCKPTPKATGVRTTCGRYSCCKVTLNNVTTYELWKLTPGSEWFKRIAGDLKSFAEAQERAELHVRKP